MTGTTPNRLANEASLYLRQHAHNPVDWHPWGEEALEKARREDKPILVSIGYAACHWCHVMERESFEDPVIASLMNQHLINIKVDREERPDVDKLYMAAVISLTGHGGWPLNCFLLPDGRPFFAGTYFPPQPRHRMPSWPQVVTAIVEMFKKRREEVEESAQRVIDTIEARGQRRAGDIPGPHILDTAFEMFVERFDTQHGGFGDRPKFPNVMNLELMARVAGRRRDQAGLDLIDLALTNMAAGGIYDHLGGGFARYSTDARWLAPHFEKMLYDNSLLPRIYLDMARRTDHTPFKDLVRDVIRYLEREMLAPEGGFYATQDADSEGEEGRFYVWQRQEIADILPPEHFEAFAEVYDVTEAGNWEGKTILRLHQDLDEVAARHNMDRKTLEARLKEDRGALFDAREARIKPARDEKRVCAWNGLAIQALSRAAALLGEARYAALAQRCADFARTHLWHEGRLMRIFSDHGGVPKTRIDAFLDDHAYLAHGLLDLYRASGRPEDLGWAIALAEQIRARFFDADTGDLFLTPHDTRALAVRMATAEDEAVPSPSGETCLVWLRLSALTGDPRWLEATEAVFKHQARTLERVPVAFPSLLCALDLYHHGTGTIVVSGPTGAPATDALLAKARAVAGPEDDVVHADPAHPPAHIAQDLLEGRLDVAQPTAFVCRGRACLAPITDPGALSPSIL